MIDGEFTVVPIVGKFGDKTPIGELRILTAALPPRPGFVFSLGIEILAVDAPHGRWPTADDATEYRLHEVAIQWDESYIAYLRSVGKL